MVCGVCNDMIVIQFKSSLYSLDPRSPDSTATIKHTEMVNNTRLMCRLAPRKGILVFIAKMKDTLKIVLCSWFLAVEEGLHAILFI